MKRFILGLAALGTLAGCGIPGSLERAPPLWNRDELLRQECERPLARGETRPAVCEARELQRQQEQQQQQQQQPQTPAPQ